MAVLHGIPGEWARVKGTVTGLWPVFLGVFVLGISLPLLFLLSLAFGLVLVVASLVWIVYAILKGLRRVESYFVGARGEESVASILKQIPDSYHVFNDYLHVDHVVVGPAGVFAVETKCWNGPVTIEDGQILINGRLPNRAPLNQVKDEARLVAEALKKLGWAGSVTPLLIFASNSFVPRRVELDRVVVMNASELIDSFKTDRIVLSPSEVERLVRLMESFVC